METKNISESAVRREEDLSRLWQIISERMTGVPGGGCPTHGSLGECPIMSQMCEAKSSRRPVYIASLYIWDETFNDSALVAKWFEDAGAESVSVAWVLYDDGYEVRDGHCEEDNVRAWEVTFLLRDH